MVHRLIVAGPGIYRAARPFDEGGDFSVWKTLSAFEQHVFKNMGNTCNHRALIGTAKVYPGLQSDNGRTVIFEQDYLQTVGQGVHLGLRTVLLMASREVG